MARSYKGKAGYKLVSTHVKAHDRKVVKRTSAKKKKGSKKAKKPAQVGMFGA